VILKQWTKIAKGAKKGSAGQKQDVTISNIAASASPSPSPSPSPSLAVSVLPGQPGPAAHAQPTQSSNPVAVATAVKAAPAPAAPVRAALSLPLPAQRQKIADLLAKTFSLSSDNASSTSASTSTSTTTTASISTKLAKELEQLCWDTYPCDASGKQTDYSAKIRTLNFNLKKNEGLRGSVVKGAVSVARLIVMTADELASKHIMEQRRHAAVEDEESRRQDWLEEHKKEIIANAVHGAGGKIAALMNANKEDEWFDFTNEMEEWSDASG